MFDYKSPIEILIGETHAEIENALHMEIQQKIGFNIDKEELIKALDYDRNQYKKGYRDGKAETERLNGWISVKDRLPEEETPELLFSAGGKVYYGSFGYSKFYAFDSSGIFAGFTSYEVSYWMYLPELPEVSEE